MAGWVGGGGELLCSHFMRHAPTHGSSTAAAAASCTPQSAVAACLPRPARQQSLTCSTTQPPFCCAVSIILAALGPWPWPKLMDSTCSRQGRGTTLGSAPRFRSLSIYFPSTALHRPRLHQQGPLHGSDSTRGIVSTWHQTMAFVAEHCGQLRSAEDASGPWSRGASSSAHSWRMPAPAPPTGTRMLSANLSSPAMGSLPGDSTNTSGDSALLSL